MIQESAYFTLRSKAVHSYVQIALEIMKLGPEAKYTYGQIALRIVKSGPET